MSSTSLSQWDMLRYKFLRTWFVGQLLIESLFILYFQISPFHVPTLCLRIVWLSWQLRQLFWRMQACIRVSQWMIMAELCVQLMCWLKVRHTSPSSVLLFASIFRIKKCWMLKACVAWMSEFLCIRQKISNQGDYFFK